MGLDLNDMWRLLWRRKLVLSAAMVIGAAGALSISRALPVLYTSKALLEVESQTPLMRDMNPTAPATTPDRVRTEADILNSRALTADVVRDLGLAGNPEFKMAPRAPTWIDRINTGLHDARIAVQRLTGSLSKPNEEAQAVELFQKRLRVDANDKSHIVAVSVATGSPELSAQAVNDLLKRYMAAQVSANLQVTSEENKWLNNHLAELQDDLDKAEARVQAYREAHRVMEIQAGALPAVQLSDEEKNLSLAEQNYADARAAYETAIGKGNAGSFAGQEALSSQLIQRLHEQEATVAQRVANMRARYGSTSPTLEAVEAELTAIRRQIASENTKIVASLKRNMNLAQDRVLALRKMVDASRTRALANVSASSTLAQLTQQVEAKRHVYNAFLTRMEQTQLASTKFASARVVSPAVPPEKADGLPMPVAVMLGSIAGFLLAAASCLLVHVRRGKIGSQGELMMLTGMAAIGSMPQVSGGLLLPSGRESVPTRILDMGDSGVVETLRALRFSVQMARGGSPCTCVLVSSALPGEGKTTLAASLAQTSAADGLRVLLIEADLRRPTLARVLGAQPAHSVQEVLAGETALPQAVHVDTRTGLHCLLSDGASFNAQLLLQSARFTGLIAQARVAYDLVIIDSPPVMRVVDPLILAMHTDCVLFAVAWERVSRQVVAEALRRFPQAIRENIATVLTRVPQSRLEHQGYYAGYKLPARA